MQEFEADVASRKKILVLGSVRPEGLEILKEFADLTILSEPVTKSQILEVIGQMDAVLHKIGKIDAEIIRHQSRLRIIARHGIGLDDLDLENIGSAGIPVSTTQDANANAVAEATIGMALCLLRNFREADTMIKRDHSWARETLMGRELGSSTVGIVGLGRIGRLVAERFSAFGAKICFHDKQVANASSVDYSALTWERMPRNNSYQPMELDELLHSADIVSLHCPLTPENHHLIDAPRLKCMKSHAVLINTARGGLIDQDALTDALINGIIGGAAIDVYDCEPPNYLAPIFSCHNVLTTPHIAAMTLDAQITMAVNAATEIRRVLVEGLAPTNNAAN